MRTKEMEKWQERVANIKTDYPFGPIQILRNEEGRMHSMTQPAFVSPTRVMWFEDGRPHGKDVDIYGSVNYYFKGVSVPKRYLEEPENLTFEEILKNSNTEARRVGMDIYGFDRILREGKAKLINTEKVNGLPVELYNINIKNKHSKQDNMSPNNDEEILALIRVQDGTPSETGERKVYFLSVPPRIQNAKEAVAWTFRKEADDYNPQIER